VIITALPLFFIPLLAGFNEAEQQMLFMPVIFQLAYFI
jgi:hypothetical protein